MVGFTELGIYPETTNGRRFGGRFNTEADSIALRDDEPVPAEQAQKEKPLRNGDADSETNACAVSRKESLAERYDTSLTLYMREIGRFKLLAPGEEIELAARIKKGDSEARDQMIKANLRLVVKIAWNYEGYGVPLPDLISEGNLGLIKAVERFDPSKGAKLSTYGARWIKQAIFRALANQSKVVRFPKHVMEQLGKMRGASMRFQEQLGREPTDEELAAELETTASRVAQMRMGGTCPVSLDAQVAGEGSHSYAETIADEKSETPYQKLEKKALRGMLQKMIKTLNRLERAVLNLRFGLEGQEPKNLAEIGKELDISGERARQIQNAAFCKLRCRIKNLELSLAPIKREFRPFVPDLNKTYASQQVL
jgi:RNA polymerase primary sigma factor